MCSMSLGFSRYRALDDAVRAAIGRGIHVSVAAGNSWTDACNVSPARVSEAYVTCSFTSLVASLLACMHTPAYGQEHDIVPNYHTKA